MKYLHLSMSVSNGKGEFTIVYYSLSQTLRVTDITIPINELHYKIIVITWLKMDNKMRLPSIATLIMDQIYGLIYE